MEESFKCKILRSYSDEHALKEVDNVELISKCENLEKELEKYKGIGAAFEEQMTRMYEECRTIRTRERRAQERILCAMDENDEWKRKCENLEARVVDLMLENKGMYEWKSKCEVLEIRMSELMEENSRLKHLHCDNVIVISDGEDDGVKIDVKEGMNSERKGGEVLITKQRSLSVMVNDDGCRKEERFLSTSTPKRKCSSRVITSDIEDEDEDDDEDDDTPIGKLKMRKKAKEYDDEDEIPIGELLSVKHTVDGDEVREDVTPCRRRLFPLREYDKMNSKKKWSDRDKNATSKMDRISRNKGNVSRKVGLLDEDDAKEEEEDRIHEVNVGDSDSGSGSLRGFIVNDSEVDDDDDSPSNSLSDLSHSNLDLGEILAQIRRGKDKKEWEYEADMLASFSKNPELCMKAVCALYRQQTSEEQSVKGTLLTNNRGFNKLDANKGSRIAEFLLDGDPTGPLKKSLEELQMYDPHGHDYCLKLARHYSKQLFMIYQNKEDPFFLPS